MNRSVTREIVVGFTISGSANCEDGENVNVTLGSDAQRAARIHEVERVVMLGAQRV